MHVAPIDDFLAAALKRRNVHYGWVVVGATFLTMLITAGTVGAPGVFIVPLQKEFGWTTSPRFPRRWRSGLLCSA